MLSRENITESVYGILPLGHYLNVCVVVTWRAMLLADSPKPDRPNVKGEILPHFARGGVKHEGNNLALSNNINIMTAGMWKMLRWLREGKDNELCFAAWNVLSLFLT
jgi:hypothetical protein